MKKLILPLLLLTFVFLVIYYVIIERQIHLFKYSTLSKKYVLFECTDNDICGGWADRLKGLLSTYAISILTNRQFLIKMTKDCDLKNILIPNKIFWDYNQIANSTPNTILNYGWNFAIQDQLRSSPVILKEFTNESLIIIKAGIMFSDVLSENPYYKIKINQLGYNQSTFKIPFQIRKWYGELFRLNENLQIKYNDLLKKMKPTNNSKLICAQLRMGDPGHVGESDEDMGIKFWTFINNTFLKNKSSNNYSIFVTSDRENFKKEAELFFVNNKVFYTDNSSVHVESKSSKCDNLEKVIFDFHLMQNCDIGVISQSGYGILGHWNRPEPFKDLYVYTKENQTQLKINYWNRKNLTFLKYDKFGDIFIS